jgi:hypothetical protein
MSSYPCRMVLGPDPKSKRDTKGPKGPQEPTNPGPLRDEAVERSHANKSHLRFLVVFPNTVTITDAILRKLPRSQSRFRDGKSSMARQEVGRDAYLLAIANQPPNVLVDPAVVFFFLPPRLLCCTSESLIMFFSASAFCSAESSCGGKRCSISWRRALNLDIAVFETAFGAPPLRLQ